MAEIDLIDTALQAGMRKQEENCKMKLAEIRREELSKTDPDIKEKLHLLENQYAKLKYDFQAQQANWYVLETLDDGRIPSVEESALDLQRGSTTLSELRDQLSDSRSSIEQLADSTQALFEEYKSLRAAVDQLVQGTKVKRQRLADLCDEVNNLLQHDDTGESAPTTQQPDAVVLAAREINRSDGQLSALQDAMEQLSQSAEALGHMTHRLHRDKHFRKWCDACLELLTRFKGVREKSFHGNTWTVELFKPNLEPDQPTLELAITFAFKRIGSPQIKYVKCSSPDCDLSDVTAEGVRRNDVSWLLTEAQRAWRHKVSLVSEVETLRKQYAVDWLQSEGKLRVLFGKALPMVCTLRVEPGYPTSGRVTLEKINDITRGEKLDKLKPACENPSLTEWLAYLHDKMMTGLKSLNSHPVTH